MSNFSKTIIALTLAVAAIPAASVAQTAGVYAPSGFERTAIAELSGRTETLANWLSYGLDPLPAGLTYGLKDSRVVVVDDVNGAVVRIVRVIAGLNQNDSGFAF